MRTSVPGLVIVLWTSSAVADPIVGGMLGFGQSLGGEAGGRLDGSIYMVATDERGWGLGGELAGSFEAYIGGYTCGSAMTAPGESVPAVAQVCMQPSAAAHALVSVQAQPSDGTLLRVIGGLGAASLWTLGSGHDDDRELAPSGLIRLGYMLHAGELAGAQWWIGVTLEERAIGLDDTRLSRAIGLAFEGASD